jgi:hypothetical protein
VGVEGRAMLSLGQTGSLAWFPCRFGWDSAAKRRSGRIRKQCIVSNGTSPSVRAGYGGHLREPAAGSMF